MILVDTSAWIVVLGELRLGSGIPDAVDLHLSRLPRLPCPGAADILRFIETRIGRVAATGAGWADISIVATAERSGALLYAADGPLRAVWRALGNRLG